MFILVSSSGVNPILYTLFKVGCFEKWGWKECSVVNEATRLLWMHAGSLEITHAARVALSCASSNSYASVVLSKLAACIHNSILNSHAKHEPILYLKWKLNSICNIQCFYKHIDQPIIVQYSQLSLVEKFYFEQKDKLITSSFPRSANTKTKNKHKGDSYK